MYTFASQESCKLFTSNSANFQCYYLFRLLLWLLKCFSYLQLEQPPNHSIRPYPATLLERGLATLTQVQPLILP